MCIRDRYQRRVRGSFGMLATPGASKRGSHPAQSFTSSISDMSELESEPEATEPLPSWRLLLLTLSMGGVYLGFGLQVGGGTAVMKNMGIPSSVVSAVWLFGPISGIIMGPLVGRYSDRCQHPMGRRRPVMVLSLIHISEPTRLLSISYAVFCLKKKKNVKNVMQSCR
eukprot:TRINITY_DN10640_c0_g1_i1.p1 TRINITY_DN10640_c0_g1~~TRINITY_DN10640_c0_g1_i1.p1  ORF type:complete len:168 (-),score=40.47 TRINITY_DN10640_c0_g1_i1:47-550(-)